jgi:hypothetical protein
LIRETGCENSYVEGSANKDAVSHIDVINQESKEEITEPESVKATELNVKSLDTNSCI